MTPAEGTMWFSRQEGRQNLPRKDLHYRSYTGCRSRLGHLVGHGRRLKVSLYETVPVQSYDRYGRIPLWHLLSKTLSGLFSVGPPP